jgi:hypothetical protein
MTVNIIGFWRLWPRGILSLNRLPTFGLQVHASQKIACSQTSRDSRAFRKLGSSREYREDPRSKSGSDVLDRKIVIVAIAAIIMSLLVGSLMIYAGMQYSREISNTATVKTVSINVFQNVNLTNPVTSIDWGMLDPGQTKNCTVYLQSTSNVPISLSMYAANWDPANASEFLTLTWNYKGQAVARSASLPAIFSLAVNASISGITSFSFDIWIVGSG